MRTEPEKELALNKGFCLISLRVDHLFGSGLFLPGYYWKKPCKWTVMEQDSFLIHHIKWLPIN